MTLRIIKLPSPLSIRQPATCVAAGFGAGLLAPAPGTWGTLAALVIGAPLFWLAGPAALLGMAALTTAAGLWACAWVEQQSHSHDDGWIVIDEWAGLSLSLAFIPSGTQVSWLWMLAAFALFRTLDILKPWPIGWIDRNTNGALGVMADDIIAGLITGSILYGASLWII